MKKYQQIKGRALVWWKLQLSVVDEPMDTEESETLAKKLQWKDISQRVSQIFLEVRHFSKAQKKTDCEICIREIMLIN